ncbi:proteasome assembly chaperone family protein [Aurantimicrobium sp. MWH-Uga1]|uniref:proteasome assembly chaperone family protein n=1 Tax=Aurantimicrobium sp. MWH-Uga1 TaxID=2079575 RepID=UPI000DED6291|nr:PAC2 family protein [Aurantimicrobium sp. MWH-Uga1]
MPEHFQLLHFKMDEELIPHGLPLVAGLTGFADSGSAVTAFTDYIVDTMDSQLIAEFDPDELLDYRARRPTIYFDQDHLTGFEPPRLAFYLVNDEINRPFILLAGYEPDFKWEAFSRQVLSFVERFNISHTTWVHAIPMPVPHTRPIGTTVSGNRGDLIDQYSVWKPHTQVPANAMHLVEYRLQESEQEVVGFVLLIPHYLADTEFPSAALTALESVSSSTGLIFPTDQLREEGREFISKIDEQVETNEELSKLVHTLEQRYDSYMKENGVRSPLTDVEGELPTADEIAAELEEFLAYRRGSEEPGDMR